MFSLQQTKPLWKSLPLQNFSDAVLNYSYHYGIVASFILYTISESSNTTLMIVDRKVLLTVDDKTTIAIYCISVTSQNCSAKYRVVKQTSKFQQESEYFVFTAST